MLTVKPKGVGVTNYSCPRMLKLQGLVLLCNFTARPKVNITWIHSNKIKGVKTSVHYGSNGLIASIGIFNITYVDDEDLIYSITCAGENQYGKATQSAMLSVKCKYLLQSSIIRTDSSIAKSFRRVSKQLIDRSKPDLTICSWF